MQTTLLQPQWLKQFSWGDLSEFQSFIWDYYCAHGRAFAWRGEHEPYHIAVSEVMLQQTQTHRVQKKYDLFIKAFPTIFSLARAELREVLAIWQGLGYNRRGKFLHMLAQQVVEEYGGVIPSDELALQKLPGIGPATAASICAFAFNQPTVFIETNIRAVFLYCFFYGQQNIADAKLLPLIAQSVDRRNPREWYYALMDYGVYLKKHVKNPSRASKHHKQQSPFEGSNRQMRGRIIRLLAQNEGVVLAQICEVVTDSSSRVQRVLEQMQKEEMICCADGIYRIA